MSYDKFEVGSPQDIGKSDFIFMRLQEVIRVHSTHKGKGQIRSIKKVHPQYIAGFIDGEGSFWVSIYKISPGHLKNIFFHFGLPITTNLFLQMASLCTR